MFLTTYTSSHDHAEIAFGSSFPGKILPVILQDGKDAHCSEKRLSCCRGRCESTGTFPQKTGYRIFRR
ncbi:MAG: AIM24 family protein [[Clostridium] innocuum]